MLLRLRQNTFLIKKTVSYYFVHITVAALVAYGITGNFVAAITLSLLEPTVQAFVFFFHEKFWQQKEQQSDIKNQLVPKFTQ